ncbi:MAG: hypothetical protein DMF53_04080 [Acidobacteria bacterium]|nr:MAG: hypothetical protein DMF53_04080 [Acidobacteriota bacterium]
MLTKRLVFVLLVSAIALLAGPRGAGCEEPGKAASSDSATFWSRLPLRFETNQGQLDPGALFVARGPGYTLALTRQGAALRLVDLPRRGMAAEATPRELDVDLRLVGGNAAPQVTGEGPAAAPANYFVGRDPNHWRRGVPTYDSVRYSAVYPGVDLIFHGRHGRLEYDFVVAPGADPGQIELGVTGADRLTVDAGGNLVISSGDRSLVQPKPVLYQEGAGGRAEVAGGYQVAGDRVRFAVAAYDRSLPLVIDPVFTFASYFGGADLEELFGIAHDAQGNIWATGLTGSLNLPVAHAVEGTYGGLGDTFVIKLDKNGTMLFATYLGGRDFEQSWGMTLDNAGNAYIVGNTKSDDFPVVGGFQTSLRGERDAYVVKLDPSGSRILYSTYLGGGGLDWGYAVDVDAKGAIYVAGETSSSDFPVRSAAQATYKGGEDAFVTKIAPDGSGIVYSTFIGGGNHERAWGVKVDAQGRAYVVGATASPNFPTKNAFQKRYGGGMSDAFMTLISGDGRSFLYSTFAGGTSTDQGFAVAIDGKGNARYVGLAGNATFPVRQALQPFYGGGNGDGFVIGLTTTGGLQFSTFLGGGLADAAFSVSLDAKANIYVTGQTESPNFPLRSALQTSLGGLRDGFLTKLRPDGKAFLFSTFFGGDAIDEGTVIDVDPNGVIYLGGFSDGNLPLVHPQQAVYGGKRDGFVARIENGSTQAVAVSCAAAVRQLPSSAGDLLDVGLSVQVDGDGTAPEIALRVFGDDGASAYDVERPQAGGLQLRAERSSSESDRVYLIVATARDRAGNRGTATCSVVVPRSAEPRDVASAFARAAGAESFFELHQALPAGFAGLDRPDFQGRQ